MVSLADIQINRGYESDDGPDEDLSYLSMESLFTPPGVGGDERRMQVRAYNHWLAMVENDELPAVEELRPEEIADFGPNGVLVDLTLGIDRPAIVYLGERLTEECGGDREIFALGDVPERSLLSRLTEHCLEVVATHSPVGFDAEFEDHAGKTIFYRSILLPYSSNGSAVDFVFGVISWKEAARSVAQPAPLPAAEPGDLAQVLPPPRLGEILTVARAAAHHAGACEARSRDALYQAISGAYNLLRAAAGDRAGFDILAAGMLTGDPARTAARLVFGAGYEKTRLSEIVTLVAHAQQLKLPHGGLYALLTAAPGGIKALVAEARRLRGGTAGVTAPRQLSRALAGRLRRIAPLATADAIPNGREFGLVVARRNPDGTLAMIGNAGGDVRLLERAAKRLLAG
jgi:hypothetical protein